MAVDQHAHEGQVALQHVGAHPQQQVEHASLCLQYVFTSTEHASHHLLCECGAAVLRAGVVGELPIDVVALEAPEQQPDRRRGHRQLGDHLRRPPGAGHERGHVVQQGSEGLGASAKAQVGDEDALAEGARDGAVEQQLQGCKERDGLDHELPALVAHEELLEGGVHKDAGVELLQERAQVAVELHDALKDAVGLVDDGGVGGAELGVEGGVRGELGGKGAGVGEVCAVEEEGRESVGLAGGEVVQGELLGDVQERGEQGVASGRLVWYIGVFILY